MFSIQQFIDLVTDVDNNAYHLITLLAIQAALGLAISHWRRERDDPLVRRFLIGSLLLFGIRLAQFILILFNQSTAELSRALLPLDSAVNTVTVLLVAWMLVPPPSRLPRVTHLALILGLAATGILYFVFRSQWLLVAPDIAYGTTGQAQIWTIIQIAILGLGMLLVPFTGRSYSEWPTHVTIIGLLLVAHIAHLVTSPTLLVSTNHASFWMRLGHLIAFPLLAVAIYRHALQWFAAEHYQNRPVGETIADTLAHSQRLVQFQDLRRRLPEALALVRDLVPAEFSALGVLATGASGQLRVVSEQGPEEERQPQSWELNLADWPSLRLAMKQRERVELVHNGLGARQLRELYTELNVGEIGPLIIEPLLVDNEEVGVLLLGAPAGIEKWSSTQMALLPTIAGFLAQVIQNSREYERQLRERSSITPGLDDRTVVGRLLIMEKERDQAVGQLDSLRLQLQRAEARALSEEAHAVELAQALDELEAKVDSQIEYSRPESPLDAPRVETLQHEVDVLRESLLQAEEALALAAANDQELSAEWVMQAITRYSAELESAQSELQALHLRLSERDRYPLDESLGLLLDELRTPLTSINGFAELLLSESAGILTRSQKNYTERIQNNVVRMRDILGQIGETIRLTTTPSSEPIPAADVNQAIETATDTIINQLHNRALYLDMNVPAGLPPAPISDEALFRIVAHLLNNACHISRQNSRVALSAEASAIADTPGSDDGAMIRFLNLTISDSSDGLKPEQIPLVFQPEHRASFGFVDGIQDAHALVVANGGRIWIESEEGVGNHFMVLLPLDGDLLTMDSSAGFTASSFELNGQ